MGNLTIDWHPILGGVVTLLVTSCYGNWDKLYLPTIHFMFNIQFE